MTPQYLLHRSRVWFATLAGLGLCVLLLGVMVAASDDIHPPPLPVAPVFFRAGWQLLLAGVVGLALHDCAAAIVAALSPPVPPAEDPPPGPRKPPRRV